MPHKQVHTVFIIFLIQCSKNSLKHRYILGIFRNNFSFAYTQKHTDLLIQKNSKSLTLILKYKMFLNLILVTNLIFAKVFRNFKNFTFYLFISVDLCNIQIFFLFSHHAVFIVEKNPITKKTVITHNLMHAHKRIKAKTYILCH